MFLSTNFFRASTPYFVVHGNPYFANVLFCDHFSFIAFTCILKHPQTSSSILKHPQVSSSILKQAQASSSILKHPQTSSSIRKQVLSLPSIPDQSCSISFMFIWSLPNLLKHPHASSNGFKFP